MKCLNAERNIFLFGELEEQEKQETLIHIASCERCARLYEETKTTTRVVTKAFAPPEPDTLKLTNLIMGKVEMLERKQKTVFDQLFDYFELKPVRYALATISLVLLISFADQLFAPSFTTITKRMPGNRTVKIDEGFYAGLVKRSASMKADLTHVSLDFCFKVCANPENEQCTACIQKYTKN